MSHKSMPKATFFTALRYLGYFEILPRCPGEACPGRRQTRTRPATCNLQPATRDSRSATHASRRQHLAQRSGCVSAPSHRLDTTSSIFCTGADQLCFRSTAGSHKKAIVNHGCICSQAQAVGFQLSGSAQVPDYRAEGGIHLLAQCLPKTQSRVECRRKG